ncbi:unnamed protein product [Caenorhabditis angaria]|uniref:C2H2-type domain-containing protein n=1 Tax=Caenorhabditis angaria TaxID=860376 RepID=A0A9P1I7L6_9PELO|nr:unnamed protein product [Caenorhabditis angaria]
MSPSGSNEWKLLYETNVAIFAGRLCAISIQSMEIPGNLWKLRISSSSDISILLQNSSIPPEIYQILLSRLKFILTSRSEDSSFIGIRIEQKTQEKGEFELLIEGNAKDVMKIDVKTADSEELSHHFMNCYAKEKAQNQANLAKIESLSKQLQAKEFECENLKMRCEYKEEENRLLRQLNASRTASASTSARKPCGGCAQEKCRCLNEEEEEEEDQSMDEEDDDDLEEEMEEDGEFRNNSLKTWLMQQDPSTLTLLRNSAGNMVLARKTQQNDQEPSTSSNYKIDEKMDSELMKKLGVIMRAAPESSPSSSSPNFQIVKTESSGPLTIENANNPQLVSTSSTQNSNSHQKNVVLGVVQYVICQLCPENEQKPTDISNLQEMEAHLLDKHVDKEKKQCEACPTNEIPANNIIQHMRIHTNSVYACQQCGKRGKKNYLRSHVRIHTGERPYSCETCPKAFTDSSTLRRHRLTHTGEKKYQCPVCGRAIARKDNVKVHIRSHGIHV